MGTSSLNQAGLISWHQRRK